MTAKESSSTQHHHEQSVRVNNIDREKPVSDIEKNYNQIIDGGHWQI